jgi:hypothetical protein
MNYLITFISLGVIFLISLRHLSGKLVNIVVPPANTISEYKVFLRSISTLFIELTSNSGIAKLF